MVRTVPTVEPGSYVIVAGRDDRASLARIISQQLRLAHTVLVACDDRYERDASRDAANSCAHPERVVVVIASIGEVHRHPSAYLKEPHE